jgi:serine/threonine protein kinase
MMVLDYCEYGNLRNFLNALEDYMNYGSKIDILQQISKGLLDIHDAGKVHKDFHSGNILLGVDKNPFISDLGMCQPASKQSVKKEGIYGVLPYMAPEVIRGHQYTKAADIYSFGIIMNEFLSEEIPYDDNPHDELLAIKICKGLRPKISENIPKLLADLIIKCWDAEIEKRPTAKELYQVLKKWNYEIVNKDSEDSKGGGEDNKSNGDSKSGKLESEIYSQIKECDEIGEKKFKSRSKSQNIQTHSQAIYTSRLLNFKDLPKPVNSTDLSSFQINSGNLIYFHLNQFYIINHNFSN